MRKAELLEVLKKQPFQPFRVCVSDGSKFEIRHPELAIAFSHALLIGQPHKTEPPPSAEQFTFIDYRHITELSRCK